MTSAAARWDAAIWSAWVSALPHVVATLGLRDNAEFVDTCPGIAEWLGAVQASLAGKVIIGMKGSYGGVLMFGILTGLAGLTLVNPISIGAGILLGGRAYREDAQNRLARRQAEARTLVRKQLDEVTFQSSKVLRDRMRHTQRSVRDHYAQVADDLSRSIAESVASAQSAAKVGEQEKQRRLAAIAADRTTVTSLQEQARSLGGPLRPPRQETTQATAS